MNVSNNFSEFKSFSKPQIKQAPVAKAPEVVTAPQQEKKDILDIFSEKVVNKDDINDMVQAPRAIFKGYLCFTAGSSLTLISSLLKNKKLNKGLTIAGSLLSIYGTYNFVKPFLVKDKNLTNNQK